MSKVEVKVRFLKEKTAQEREEEAEEIKYQKLVQGDDYVPVEAPEKYTYEKGLLDLKDVVFSNYVDPQHTCLRLNTGNSFVIKVKYDDYVDVYQKLTGYTITLLYEDENIVN